MIIFVIYTSKNVLNNLTTSKEFFFEGVLIIIFEFCTSKNVRKSETASKEFFSKVHS